MRFPNENAIGGGYHINLWIQRLFPVRCSIDRPIYRAADELSSSGRSGTLTFFYQEPTVFPNTNLNRGTLMRTSKTPGRKAGKDIGQKTITRAHISKAVHRKVGISLNESADLLQLTLDEISLALERGESVKILTFGSFSVRTKRPHLLYNIQTGQERLVPAKPVMVFQPSRQLNSRVTAGCCRKAARSKKTT